LKQASIALSPLIEFLEKSKAVHPRFTARQAYDIISPQAFPPIKSSISRITLHATAVDMPE
jgi:hypothetical protein